MRPLADRVATPATVINPTRLFPVAGAAGEALTVNDSMGTLDLFRLARAMRTIAGGGMTTAIVPARPANVGGAAVLIPTDEAPAVYAAFASGAALEAPEELPEPEALRDS